MAGISILRRLLMKEAMIKNAPFQNEGIMSISKALATNINSKVNKIVEGAKRQGIDFDQYNEEQIKYILELNKKKLEPRVISADSPEGRGITEALLGRKEGKVIKRDFGKPFAEEMVTPVERVITDIKKMKPIEAMKEANKVLKGEGRYKNLSQADREKIVNDESVTDHIFERQKLRDADDPNYDAEPADFDPDADNETFAIGGRVGLKTGMSKRAFLKLMGGAAAGIGALKAGALKMFGKEAAPVVEKAAEAASGAPSYFFDLVEKIKLFGKRSKVGPQERVNEFTYTGKDGSDYVMTEDIVTGDIKITKDKLGGANYGDMSYDTIEDRTEMVFRKGQMDETTKGKKPPDEYEEYKVEFDQDGTAADATDIDEISKSEIIKEVSDDAPSIKKAGGGIARMLGE
tara:strand:- start:2066 stop:3277 length:1212 start_codon:yes stop_codon:yes gene_type:complete